METNEYHLSADENRYLKEKNLSYADIADFKLFKAMVVLYYKNKRISLFDTKNQYLKIINLDQPYSNIRSILEKNKKYISEVDIQAVEEAFKEFNKRKMKIAQFLKKAVFKDEKGNVRNKRVYDDNKTVLLELFGKMFNVDEVFVICKKEYKINVDIKGLSLFYKQNFDKITILVEEYKRNHNNLRLATKTSRLEELTYLYGVSRDKFEISHSKSDHELMLKTLAEIRKEVEGEKITIENNINLNLHETINLQIRQEMMKHYNLYEIILARISSRIGKNPIFLMKELNDSVYSRYNSLLGNKGENEVDEFILPSKQTYDFEYIKNQQAVIQNELEEKINQAEYVKNEEIKNVGDTKLRDLLKQKIFESREVLNSLDEIEAKEQDD